MTVPDRFKVAAMLNPRSGETHLKLARLYFINGDPSSADRETQLAIQLSEVSGNPNYSVLSESVLGASSGPTNGLSGLRDEITRQLSAYAFWKSIASDKPDYVSAQIATASYAYMLGKYTEADNFLSNALSLDPTNPEVVSLADQIKTR